jgi:hypothetical protein
MESVRNLNLYISDLVSHTALNKTEEFLIKYLIIAVINLFKILILDKNDIFVQINHNLSFL